MYKSITQRIKIILKEKNISETELSSLIGMSQRTVNNYINESRKVSFEFVENLVRTFELNANWLITGEGEMYIDNTPVLQDEKAKGAIPYYADLPVSAGRAGLSQAGQEENPSGYMSIPNVSAESIFPVIGCSMLPRIKAGDVIGVNRVNRWERVEPDKIYMIITNDERMLKRLRIDNEDNNILWCVSDNYQEFKIYKSEILNIYHVVYHGEML